MLEYVLIYIHVRYCKQVIVIKINTMRRIIYKID